MLTKTIMSKSPVTCCVSDTLNTAAHRMWEHDCGVIPVVDEAGQLVGVVTDRDICMATYTQGRPPQEIGISTAMAKQVWSCHPSDTIAVAEQLMRDKQVRRIPVVDDDGRPVGVLSMNDIARHAIATKQRNSVDRALVDTLAAVCCPRPHEATTATTAAV